MASMQNLTVGCKLGIAGICDSSEEELTVWVRHHFVVGLGIAMLVVVTGHILHLKHLNALPESLVTVLWGSILGIILYVMPWGAEPFDLDTEFVRLAFGWVLNFIALPIIIFESGWSLRTRDFASQIGYIMLFAIVGTVLSILVVATLIHCTQQWHGIETWRAALAFASLISSVDPVATLSTFNQLNVDPLLFILVFGESQINDAVAITVFDALNKHGLEEPMALLGTMATSLAGSIALGFGLAVIYVLVLRFARMGTSPAQAILFVFLSCFFTFSLAEWLNLSGIITVVFNSILMGSYVPPHLSAESMALCSFLLKQMATLSDAVIFLFSGIMAVFVVTTNVYGGIVFGLACCLFCMVGRFASVVPLSMLSNAMKRSVAKNLPKEKEHIITWKHMFMMWHSGLRGGISLVMVLELGDWVDSDEHPGAKFEMMNGTFILVVLYLLAFGSTAGPCLRRLGLPLGDEVPEGQRLYESSDKQGLGWRALKLLRRRVFKPMLIGSASTADGKGLTDVEAGARASNPEGGCAATFSFADRLATEAGEAEGGQRTRDDHRASILGLFGTMDPTHQEDRDRCLARRASDSLGQASGQPPRASGRRSTEPNPSFVEV
jgi:NhaP-type Na+/H+ or K+/H+ antiporter